MTKRQMMLAMGYKPHFVNDLYCQKHYIQRYRKETFIKALDLYNNVSHTKGKAYWIKPTGLRIMLLLEDNASLW